MKKGILVALLLVAALSLVCPQAGYSHGSYAWYVPGAFIGEALFGAAISRPAYVAPPPVYAAPAPPVYAYPAPVYVYPAPRYYPAYRYHGYYGPRGYYGHRW